jgi:C-terminal processing protease CtpA/Prc
MRQRRILVLTGLLLLLRIVPALAQEPAQPQEVDRLVHLAKLWGTVRFLHPYLAYKEIDWEEALVKAIPAVRSARTPREYADAVQSMLGALGDPATRVRPVPAPPAPEEQSRKPPPLYRWLDASTLLVHLRPDLDNMPSADLEAAFKKLGEELPRASRVILDIRSLWGLRFQPEYALRQFNSLLVSRPVDPPAQRFVFHSGYRTQVDGPGGYFSGFQTPAVDRLLPEPGTTPRRVVFLVNADTRVPPVAAALQASGDGAIVSEGPLSDAQLVRQQEIDLGEGFQAWVRTSEVLPRPGWNGLHADAEAAGDDAMTAAALRLLQQPSQPPAGPVAALPELSWRPDPRRDGMTEPSLEYRLLAVIKLWNVFHYFFPSLALTDGDWDAALPEFLARMERVKDGREYALAVAEMAARADDGHVSLYGNPTLDALYGAKPAPVAVRWIEGAWVIVQVGEPVKGSGAQVGDVILTLDGRPVAEREAELRRHFAASTEAGMRRKIADRLLSGPDGSELVLTVRGRGDRIREVRLRRQDWKPGFAGETVRILPGNLGYVDLNRLRIPEVDALFEKVKDTRALILDMRGYPNGTAWFLAPRLNTRGAELGALFRRPWVSGLENGLEQAVLSQAQRIPPSDAPKYARPTVMLIDERTVSQAEHTGLFLEMSNGTKFVGTPTAGANGDITHLFLPGFASVRFSGAEVRHADGRQLQRIGLVPDVPVAPTIQGIRDGKDEVLDRAVRYLNQELAKSPAPAAAGSPAGRTDAPGSGEAGPSR